MVDKIGSDEESVRRLVARFEDPGRVWACYEAGPTGYELARQRGLGVHCAVIAPSLIPSRPGDRVKTDRRDAARMATLLRAGQLSSVRVPTVAEEGVRDLCRARGPTWSSTRPGPATGWASSCSATAGSRVTVPTGR